MIALIIIACVLLIAVAFVMCPLKFGVSYLKTASREDLFIYVSIFGILIKIPINTIKDKPKVKKKKNKKEFSFESFKQNIENIGEVVTECKESLFEMLSYVRKNLNCDSAEFKIAFGTGDAAKTGITTGAVWTAGSFLLKIVDTLVGINKINMSVYPDFTQKKFEIYFKTILIMRPIHFIIVLRKIVSSIKFIKAKIKI